MEAYELSTPQQLRAGYVGSAVFNFSCAGCGKADAEIVGLLSEGPPIPGFGNVAVIEGSPARLALYCGRCWPDRIAPLVAERAAA